MRCTWSRQLYSLCDGARPSAAPRHGVAPHALLGSLTAHPLGNMSLLRRRQRLFQPRGS
jgi:hypothetical protein